MSHYEMIEIGAMLTTIGTLAMICWCQHIQWKREQAAEQARHEAQLQAIREQAARDWYEMRRQMHALPEDIKKDAAKAAADGDDGDYKENFLVVLVPRPTEQEDTP